MSNLLASFNSGVSGIHSAQASLNNTAHNMANAHTEGYTRQQVMVTDSFYQNSLGPYNNKLQVGTGTVIAMTRQIRNEFLDIQYRVQLGRQCFYEANSKAAMEVEDMMGELHQEQFSEQINSLWKALSSVANSADSLVDKEELVSMASRFISDAQVLQRELDAYQTSLNTEVKEQVDAINHAVSEIKDLNELIRKYEATGDSANDYRDKRNLYLDELSQYILFETTEEVDGTISIYTNGRFILEESNQLYLSTTYESEKSHLLKPIWESGENFFTTESLAFSSANNSDIGSLRGLMVARGSYAANYTDVPVKPKQEDFATETEYRVAMNQFDDELKAYNNLVGASVIMTSQSQLDTLIHGIVSLINDALCPNKEVTVKDAEGNTSTIRVLDEQKALLGDDANNTVGTELFSRRSRERYTKVEGVTVVGEDGTETTQDFYVYNEEDPEDPYSLYTLSQLVINPVVQRDASTLPSIYNQYQDHPGGYATNELMAIANAFSEDIGTLNPNSETTYNVFNFYAGMVSQLSVSGGIWNSIIDNQEITVATLENERQNVMGVSTDEELSNLIKFQQCYNASARYITTISEMLEYIIERLGG